MISEPSSFAFGRHTCLTPAFAESAKHADQLIQQLSGRRFSMQGVCSSRRKNAAALRILTHLQMNAYPLSYPLFLLPSQMTTDAVLQVAATHDGDQGVSSMLNAAEAHFPYAVEDCAPGERPDTIHVTGLPRRWFRAKAEEQGAIYG